MKLIGQDGDNFIAWVSQDEVAQIMGYHHMWNLKNSSAAEPKVGNEIDVTESFTRLESLVKTKGDLVSLAATLEKMSTTLRVWSEKVPEEKIKQTAVKR